MPKAAFCSVTYMTHRDWQIGITWFLTRFVEDPHDRVWWLLIATTPPYVPAIFPLQMPKQYPKALSVLALNSRFWSAAAESKVNQLLPFDRTKAHLADRRALFLDDAIRVDSHLLSMAERLLHEPDPERIMRLARTDPVPLPRNPFFQLVSFLDQSPLPVDRFLVMEPILEGCISLLNSPASFRFMLDGFDGNKKQLFRILALIQLKELDRWLRGMQVRAICRLLPLYLNTCAFLSADEAVGRGPRGKFGSHNDAPDAAEVEHPDSWMSLSLEQAGLTPDSSLARHFVLLQSLGHFFEVNPMPSTDSDDAAKDLDPSWRPWVDLLMDVFPSIFQETQPDWGGERILSNLIGLKIWMGSLARMLELCKETFRGHMKKENPTSPAEPTPGSDGQSEMESMTCPQEEKTKDRQPVTSGGSRAETEAPNNDGAGNTSCPDSAPNPSQEAGAASELDRTIDDVLVWRSILIAMLYWTAPDSTEMLSSGVWNHIIPVI